MADIAEKLRAEFENIESVVAELRGIPDPSRLSVLELAGAGAMLQSMYNAFENIFKQIIVCRGESLPSGPSWHRDLLESALTSGIISGELQTALRRYAAFRHFFGHAYATYVDSERIAPLIVDASRAAEAFEREVRQSVGLSDG